MARQLIQGGLSTFARFSVMHGDVKGTVSEDQKQVLTSLHSAYDMNSHTQADSDQANLLTPEFIDSYAIVGGPDDCIHRLIQLAELGIQKVAVIGPGAGVNREEAVKAEQLMAEEVLPAF